MTISATTNRVSTNGNGATTAFPVTFPFHAKADLVVLSTVIATGVQTTKALTTDYTISGTTDSLGHYPNGGSVTFLTAPASTERITIYRDPSRIQGLDLQDLSSFPAESLEAQLDYATMLVQRVADLIGRSLRQPDGDSADLARLPATVDRASQYLGFDSAGDPIALASPANTTAVSAFMATVLDDTTAAAARTTLGANAMPDSEFRVVGSSDATKKVALEVDGLTTGTTRTITVPNQDLVLTNLWTGIQDFRLSLTTAVPVTTADVIGAGTLYAVPYVGNRIALYNGTAWLLRNPAQMSLALVLTSGKPYDVFCYDNAGTPTLEVLVWTNDTTRATALAYQDGVLVKSGDATRRYLGTLYASGANTTEDSAAKRYLWNYYHRKRRAMASAPETADSWTYTTATWRQANANAANQLDAVIGVSEDPVTVDVHGNAHSSLNAEAPISVGVGVSSTSVNSAQVSGQIGNASGSNGNCDAKYRGFPGAGRHTFVWLEQSIASGVTTWYGDGGVGYVQSGITGVMKG